MASDLDLFKSIDTNNRDRLKKEDINKLIKDINEARKSRGWSTLNIDDLNISQNNSFVEESFWQRLKDAINYNNEKVAWQHEFPNDIPTDASIIWAKTYNQYRLAVQDIKNLVKCSSGCTSVCQISCTSSCGEDCTGSCTKTCSGCANSCSGSCTRSCSGNCISGATESGRPWPWS